VSRDLVIAEHKSVFAEQALKRKVAEKPADSSWHGPWIIGLRRQSVYDHIVPW